MDIEIHKYNTKDYEIEIKNYDGEVSKLNFSVEDCDKNLMFKKTLNNGITKVDDNKYVLTITPSDTQDMNPLYTYKYFIELLANSPNFVDTTQIGEFILKESSKNLGGEING